MPTTKIDEAEDVIELLKMIRSELGLNSILFTIASDDLAGKNLEDIDEEIFFEMLNAGKPSEEDSELFLSCFQSFDILNVQEWMLRDIHYADENVSLALMQNFT